MNLAVWSPPGSERVRIYVNDHPWGDAKVWIEPAGEGIKIITNQRRLWHTVQVQVAEYLASRFDGRAAPPWSLLLEAAGEGGVRQPRPPRPQRYGEDHTAALDPNAMKDPLPGSTYIQVDHREPAEIVERLQAVENLEVEIATLTVGDYAVLGDSGEPAVLIERKTVNDLCTSITEDAKRLFFQTNELKAADAIAVLLIEGDLWTGTRLSLPSITGTLSYLVTHQRVAPVPTIDMAHSAYTIVKLARHGVHGLGYDLGLRASGPKDVRDAASYVLQGIPGVSAGRALALLDTFGSVRGVCEADVESLQRVGGIGPNTAAKIRATLGDPG